MVLNSKKRRLGLMISNWLFISKIQWFYNYKLLRVVSNKEMALHSDHAFQPHCQTVIQALSIFDPNLWAFSYLIVLLPAFFLPMVLRYCAIIMNLMIFFSVFCFFLLIIGLSLDSLAWYTNPVSWLQHTVRSHIVPLLLKPLRIFNFPLIPNNPCPLKFSFSLSSLFWLTPSGLSKEDETWCVSV